MGNLTVVNNYIIQATAAWSPLSLPSLLAWYPFDVTANITSSGGLVSQVLDASGNGHHFVQSTASRKPTTGASTINGLNVLDATDGNTIMDTTGSNPSTASPWTALMVFRSDTASSFRLAIDFGSPGAGNAYLGGNGSSWILNGLGSGGTYSATTLYNAVATIKGASSTLVANGTTQITASSTMVVSGLNIFQQSVGGNPFNGKWAEIALMSGTISAGDLTSWNSYCQSKWGTP